MSVRYDKQFNKEIARIVRNYNAKITSLQKKGFKYLPEKETITNIKQAWDTRYDIKRRLKQLKSFSQRGAEKEITLKSGMVTTRYTLRVMKQDRRLALRRLQKRYEHTANLVPRSTTSNQGFTLGQMMMNPKLLNMKSKLERLKAKDFAENVGAGELLKGVLQFNKAREKQFKDYFIENLSNLARMYGIESEQLDKLTKIINSMDGDEFMDLYETEPAFRNLADEYAINQDPTDKSQVGKVKNWIDDLVSNYTNIANKYIDSNHNTLN